jgi:hypothetical protein
MNIFTRLYQNAKLRSRRRQFEVGKTVSRFIAKDVRRDVLVVSSSRIAEGIIVGRYRTTNVLYTSRGLTEEPAFGEPQEIVLDHIWDWTGQDWGGLPDGTSLADKE